jgi:hypothetical protein
MITPDASPFQLREANETTDELDVTDRETPFLDSYSTSVEQLERESETTFSPAVNAWTPQVETPFLAEFSGQQPADQEALAVEQALMELFDRDFNESLANLALEASAQAEVAGGLQQPTAAEQMVREWLHPLQGASEDLVDRISAAAGEKNIEAMDEAEFETFFEPFAPAPGMVSPEFEEFFQHFWNKIKKVAKGAWNLAKKGVKALGKLAMPIGLLLKKLGKLVRPLLNRVVKFAIGRLPVSLRPVATVVGRKLGILRETSMEADELPGESATTPEVNAIAQEFDTSVAMLMFARDEAELELLEAEAGEEFAASVEESSLAELDAARERFVSRFSQLEQGENPAPVVQEFIPAILPLLRIGVRVVGRQRIVNFLAGLVSKLIRPYVGPQASTALSRALVDVGLRMVTLEVEEAPPQIAARAVAATLEDTVRRISEFGFESFENIDQSHDQQQLLEALTSEAFFEAAIAHFPAQLLDKQRLEAREMAMESFEEGEVWAYRPHPKYKKYSKVFNVTVTPQIANAVRTFGSTTLMAFFNARGVKTPVTAKVHLYEAIPGTTLSHIAVLERNVKGLGSGSQAAWSQLHPLTTQAAGMLLKEPGLGKDMDARWMQSRNMIGVGQRFYFLEIATGGGSSTKIQPSCTATSQVNVTIDLKASQVRVYAYFSEADAQRVVAAGPTAGAMTGVRVVMGLATGAINSLATGPSSHVTVIREATGDLEGEEFWQKIVGDAAKRIVIWLLTELAKALLQALKAALIQYFNRRLAEFSSATRGPACGVTLAFTFNHPGLRVLQAALAGRVPNMNDARVAARAIQLPSVAISPGLRRN